MSMSDIKANLDVYTEALVKSGAEQMGPQDARDTLDERIKPIIECISHIVWLSGANGDDFRKSAAALMSDALDDAFGDAIREAQFESPIGHNSAARLQRHYGTMNTRQQGLVHGAVLR